jgi:hypothetical protein
MKKMLNEGNQIHNFIPSSGSGTVINYGSGSDFLNNYGSRSGSGSTSQKVTVPTVPVPQHCFFTVQVYDKVIKVDIPICCLCLEAIVSRLTNSRQNLAGSSIANDHSLLHEFHLKNILLFLFF